MDSLEILKVNAILLETHLNDILCFQTREKTKQNNKKSHLFDCLGTGSGNDQFLFSPSWFNIIFCFVTLTKYDLTSFLFGFVGKKVPRTNDHLNPQAKTAVKILTIMFLIYESVKGYEIFT